MSSSPSAASSRSSSPASRAGDAAEAASRPQTPEVMVSHDIESLAPILLGHEPIPNSVVTSHLFADALHSYRIPIPSLRARMRPEILTLILLNYLPCALQHSDADVFEMLLCFYTEALQKLMNVEEGDDKRDFITGMRDLDLHTIHLLNRLIAYNLSEFLILTEMLPSNLSVLQRIVHSLLRHHLMSIGGIFSNTSFMRCEATIECTTVIVDEHEFDTWSLVSTSDGAVHPETRHMWHQQIYNFGLLVRMLHVLTIAPVLIDDADEKDDEKEATSSSSTTSLTVQHTAPSRSEIAHLEEQLGEVMRTVLLNDRLTHLKMLREHAACIDVRHHAFIVDSCPTVFRVLCDVPGAWEHLLGQERDAKRIGILERAFLASTSRAVRCDMARSHNFACNVPQVLVDAAVQQDQELVLTMIANWRLQSRDNEMLSGGALLQYATTMHLAGHVSSERLLELAREIPDPEYPVHSEVLSLCSIMVRDGWQRNVARELYSVIRKWVKKTELARIFMESFFNDPDPFSFPHVTSLVEWSAIAAQHEANDTEHRSLLNAAAFCRELYISRNADGALPCIGNLLQMITASTISGVISLLKRSDEVTRENRELLVKHMWLIVLRCNSEQLSRLYATSLNMQQNAINHLLMFEERLLRCSAGALRGRLTPYNPAAHAATSWIIENVREVSSISNKKQWNSTLKLLLDDSGIQWRAFDDATVATFLHRVLPQRSDPVNLECERLDVNPVTRMVLRERGWLHDYSMSKSKRRVKFNWKSLNFWGHFTQAVLSDRRGIARLCTQNGGGQDVGGLTKDLYSRLGAEITELFFERRGGYLIIRSDVSLHECIFIGRFLSRAIYIDGFRPDMDLHPAMLYTICLQSRNSMYLLASSDEVLRMFLVPREYPDWFRDACGNMPNPDGLPLKQFIPRVISELCADRIDQILTIANAFHNSPMSLPCPDPTPLFLWNAIRRPSVDIDGLVALVEFELNGQEGANAINMIRDYGNALKCALGRITQNQFLILCRMWCGSSRPSDKLKAQVFNRNTHYIIAHTCFNTIEIPHREYSDVDDLATHLQSLIEFTTDQQHEYERAGIAFQMI